MPTKDLRPVIKLCVRCQHLTLESTETLDGAGRVVEIEAYWWCGILCGALFLDNSANAKGNGAYIELETDLPEDCPYTLEQALSQDTAGRERWVDLLPLLMERI